MLGLNERDRPFSGPSVITLQTIQGDIAGGYRRCRDTAFRADKQTFNVALPGVTRHHRAEVTADQSVVSITMSSRSEAILAIFTASW